MPKPEIEMLSELVGKYSLGFWAKISAGWALDGLIIRVMARIPDADSPDWPKFGPTSFVGTKKILMGELVHAMSEEEMHEHVRRTLKHMWMRAAAHEFEEWLRYEGKRVYEPHPKQDLPT